MSCLLICQTQSNSLEIRNSIDCLQLCSLSKSDAVRSFASRMKIRAKEKVAAIAVPLTQGKLNAVRVR